MKLTDWIVNKVGADKVMHFTIFALVVAMLMPFGTDTMVLGAFVMAVVTWVKEAYLDSVSDSNDWLAGLFGGVFAIAWHEIIMWILE